MNTQQEKLLQQLTETLTELKEEAKQFNTKISSIEQSIKDLKIEIAKKSSTESEEKFFIPFLDVLKKWISCEKYEIKFELATDGMNREKIREELTNKERVMILVQDTNNNIFGCYQKSKTVFDVNENDSYGAYTRANKEDFMVFTLNNSFIPEPCFTRKKEDGFAIKLYPVENPTWIFGAHCCFYIGTGDNSFNSPKVKDQYDVKNHSENALFTGSYFPSLFSYSNIIILHWN